MATRSPIKRRTLLLCLLSWPAAAETPFTLDALMARLAAAGPRRARFTETRRYAALEGALESRGWLSFEAGRLVKTTDWPDPERLEVDGTRIVITAGNEPPRVIDMAMAPPLRILIEAVRGPLAGDIASLHRAFDVQLAGTWPAWSLRLVPLAAGPVHDVRLQGAGDVITGIIVKQANGDEQAMVISPS